MRMSFNARLSWQTAIILSATMLVVFAYTWYRAQVMVGELSGRVVRQTSLQIEERIESFFERTEEHSRVLSGLAIPSSQLNETSLNSGRFRELASQMVELIKGNPEFSSMSIVLESTGEYVQVVQRQDGNISADIITLQDGGGRARRRYARFGGRLILSAFEADWPRDPREDEGYTLAAESREQSWTSTRVIRTPGLPETPGVTCATPITDVRGRFVGVASVDFTLTGLSRYLQTIRVGVTGYAFLAEMRVGGVARIIAHPDPNRLLVSEGGSVQLKTAAELGDQKVLLLLDHIQGLDEVPAGPSGRIKMKVGGRSYLAGFNRLGGDGRPDWVLGIVVPPEDFMGDLGKDRTVLAVFAIIALLAGIYVSLLLAHKIAAPVQAIVEETERIRALNFKPRPLPSSQIVELDSLGDAMEQLKTNLRSFEKLVPAEYARHLVATGQEAVLGGERRHLTISFADLVGFTRLSETMPAEELLGVLSEYLELLSREVMEHEGTVDKFNGDDVMAFWGAPNEVENPALCACVTAVRSQEALLVLHEELRDQGKPLLRASFGISTGDVIVGNIGSSERMNYTVIGDAVNMASRLQGLNKYYETEMLVGGQTMREAGDKIVTRLIDYVTVAGRAHPAQVYELIGLAGEVATEELDLAAMHNEAMGLYRDRSFAKASESFRTVLAARPDDGPARILLRRSEKYIENEPDADWDGSHRVDVK